VAIYYRNYTSVSGLMIPFVLETVVEKTKTAVNRQIKIEKVTLNPQLEASVFAKPDISGMSLPPDSRRSALAKLSAAGTAKTETSNEKSNEKNR
jgi:hypothetical protein